ncbi:toll/interleukin-1 receptor domain-containing protein [Jejudonia soesokkakensis]|uniref:Toll/interleukin-1 receptor domain-containing protein n=1 Tax=Jejudonia soesokkakensis TaxID=1323432 RepID=A0ABW2MWS2_9FLAO
MSTNTIFFSYSRDNSEFVLQLAKELRESGATVWLDQLDIKPGSHWDKSIETALEESPTLVVVLSKASVASHNVMDEVSYALEEGKTVVPVLYEACEIPFRLRRLQFADFTSSHEKGMATLRTALQNDSTSVYERTQPKPTAANTAEEGSSFKKTKQHATDSKSIHSSGKSKKPIIYAVVALVAIVAIYGIYSAVAGGEKDMMALCKADWQELETTMTEGKEINELAALRKHIELYAPCPHEDEAMDRISFLNEMGADLNNSTIVVEKDATDESITTIPSSKTTSDTQNQPIKISEKEELTGLTVKQVSYDTGNFEEKSAKLWIEKNNDGERRFTVLKRTKNAVYLGEGPDVRITLDIENAVILYSDAETEPITLYYITSTSTTNN